MLVVKLPQAADALQAGNIGMACTFHELSRISVAVALSLVNLNRILMPIGKKVQVTTEFDALQGTFAPAGGRRSFGTGKLRTRRSFRAAIFSGFPLSVNILCTTEKSDVQISFDQRQKPGFASS